MARINRGRIGRINYNGDHRSRSATSHSIVHCGPNAAAICRLKKAIAECAGVDRQRCGGVDRQSMNTRRSWNAKVVLGDPGAAVVDAFIHTIVPANIHRRRRCGIEDDRKQIRETQRGRNHGSPVGAAICCLVPTEEMANVNSLRVSWIYRHRVAKVRAWQVGGSYLGPGTTSVSAAVEAV